MFLGIWAVIGKLSKNAVKSTLFPLIAYKMIFPKIKFGKAVFIFGNLLFVFGDSLLFLGKCDDKERKVFNA